MSRSNPMFPEPGHGYTIKERLGAGYWKEAFRASSSSHGRDIAVIFFRDPSEKNEPVREASKLLKLAASDHPDAIYIADFYGVNYSPEKKMFFVEELLEYPLDHIGKVTLLLTYPLILYDAESVGKGRVFA